MQTKINSEDKMKKRTISMLLCCLIPLIIVGILFYFGLKTYAVLSLILLCPVLYYFMMKDMCKKHKNGIGKE